MRIICKLFAILKDKAGVGEVVLELPPPATVNDAAAEISRRYQSVGEFLRRSAFAVNREYVPGTTLLSDGDELALIPPVSGG